MKHSAKLGRRLLARHHDQQRVDGALVFPPKTEEAPLLWKHTGVCVACHRRAIAGGICRHCGKDHLEETR